MTNYIGINGKKAETHRTTDEAYGEAEREIECD